MKNALILHGKPGKDTYFDEATPSASNQIWIPWLQQQLLLAGLPTQTPEMLNAWQPDYKLWSDIFKNFRVTEDTTIIAHSIGCGFILQWLCEHVEVEVRDIILVAPSIGDRLTPEAPMDVPLLNGFGDFELDPDLLKGIRSLTVFNSDNDGPRIQATVKYIRETIPGVKYREFHNYGHFTANSGMPSGDTFPELLEAVLALHAQN